MKITKLSGFLALAIVVLLGLNSVQAQSTQDKKAVLDEIVSVTVPIYALDSLKTDTNKNVNQQMDTLVKDLRAGLSRKLDTISELTAEDRENVMTNFGPFANKFREHCQMVIERDLDPNAWVAKSLRASLSEKFTNEELIKLNDYLKGEHGKLLLAILKEEVQAQTEERESRTEQMMKDGDEEELSEFFDSPIGTKYLDTFDAKFGEVLFASIEAWKTKMLSDIDKEMEEGTLFQMLTQFMIDNKLGRPQ